MAESAKFPARASSRISPTRMRDGTRILDIETYAPFLLNATSSAWQRMTSADYRARFGVGIAEWRLLSMLNIEPRITANRVCQVIRMDKSAASRTLGELSDKGLVAFDAPGPDPRKRLWRLSDAGRAVHDRVLEAALGHEARMVRDIPPEDYTIFLRVIRQMLANLDSDG